MLLNMFPTQNRNTMVFFKGKERKFRVIFLGLDVEMGDFVLLNIKHTRRLLDFSSAGRVVGVF